MRQRSWASSGFAGFLSALLLVACASNPVRITSVALDDVVQAHQVSAFDGRGISDRTMSVLDRIGLDKAEHEVAVRALESPVEGLETRERLMARSELQFHLGDRDRDATRFLAAAFDALAVMAADAEPMGVRIDPLRHLALEHYGYSLTRFLVVCLEADPGLPELLETLESRFGLEIEWSASESWKLRDFDRWLVADTMRFEGLRHRYRRMGAGAQLVMQRDAARGIPAYLTPEAVTRGATALLLPPTNADHRGRLRLLDPRNARAVDLCPGMSVPVAADFTAPFGFLLAQAKLHELENSSFFRASAEGHEGLYLLEDYDPDRQPVVMIHGLWSSPLTWRDLTNDVFGDPTLHHRFQVWHYMYATGAPLLENARLLRKTLRKARRDLDPEQDDFAMSQFVLVGHSMGGLLTRMCLLDTGDAVWDTLFEGDFDDVKLTLDDRERELAEGLYFWNSLPFVERAIFIAAPHRGSDLSDSWIGRLGSWLMYVPGRLRRLVDKIRSRSGVRVEVPTSVDELSGQHPVLRTLASLRIRDGVPHHCIMGDVSGSKDPSEWTDGIVPFSSSRLVGASSQRLIRGADHSVHFDPRASAEVRRILRRSPSSASPRPSKVDDREAREGRAGPAKR